MRARLLVSFVIFISILNFYYFYFFKYIFFLSRAANVYACLFVCICC